MTFTSSCRLAVGTITSVVVLAACGGPAAPASTGSASSSPQPSLSTPGSGSNAAKNLALSPTDLPAALSAFVQSSDGLLGTAPNTNSRVFANSANTTRVEVDIAVDTSVSSATTDYQAYQAAASRLVPTQTGTSTPAIGQQAKEFAGTDSSSHSAVSLSFLEGSDIVVVSMVSSSATVDASVVEAVARAQDSKITHL
ncbi:MAG: hypothetical protein M3R48_09995 [Candidatus Dormibacteraeota bacterium]|nr:hypothetical protein [Candidatus Dormibacteraeota bacterium]